MHLLMTTDTVGGVWTYSLELARALAPYDVWISLATMGARLTPDQRLDAARLGNVEIFESDYRLEWMEDGWDDVADAGVWLLEIARDTRPDLVHLNQFAHGASHWNAPCMVVGHSCVLSWLKCVRRQSPGSQQRLYRQIVKCGLQGADMVVAPTQAMMKMLHEFYGPLRETRTILNGRRSDFGQRAAKEPLVFTAGRVWDEAKNIGAVAAVAPQLGWPVHVAGLPHPSGDGADETTADNLTFLGRLSSDQMQEQYRCASIYALPARYEPFGLTPLEAALAGSALVLGDIPTLREVWGDAAVFVPPDDHDALAAAINDLIADEGRRIGFIDKAQARARELNESRMAAAYMQAYHELIDGGRRSFALSSLAMPLTAKGAI